MDKPNILWICSDQQRWDTLGCYGNSFVRTPNLDNLAGQGVLFEQCYSQSPVCTPSRASFLTGRYPRTTRCRRNGQNIPDGTLLVTKLLAEAGYTCGLSGKLHLSACEPNVCKTMEPRIDDGYTEFHWSHHSGEGWGFNNEYWAWLQEQGAGYETKPHHDSIYIQIGMPEELHQTTWCAEKAIDFIKAKAKSDDPWLFSINMFDPHHPFDAPLEYLERYLGFLEEIPLPNYLDGELENKTPFQQIDHKGAYGGRTGYFSFDKMTDTDHRMVRVSYWAMCDLIDVQVGRVLKALKETGQINNTIVIFMSDHGEMLGDHGIYLKGPYFYEPAVHVPLIISNPGLIKHQRSSALVELVDLAPTLLDAAGLRHPGMQSKSLWPILMNAGSTHHHRDDIYCEHYASHRESAAYLTMIRTDQYKIVVDHCHHIGELYDLTSASGENHNLWDDPNLQDMKMEMLLRLCNRMAGTVDPLPEHIANW